MDASTPSPQDKHGEPLQVGDIVMVPAIVTKIEPVPEFYNVELETTETMFPGNHKTPILLNAKQVEKPVVVTTDNFQELVHKIPATRAALLHPSLVTVTVSPGDTVIVKTGDATPRVAIQAQILEPDEGDIHE